jgi:esterase/lipase
LPIEAVVAMTAGVAEIDLTAVDRPVLLVTSANDDVVDPASSDRIADALRCDMQRLRLRNSGHVATLGGERHLLQRATVDFVSDSTGSHPTRGR